MVASDRKDGTSAENGVITLYTDWHGSRVFRFFPQFVIRVLRQDEAGIVTVLSHLLK